MAAGTVTSHRVGGARAEWGDVRGVRQYKSSCQWNAQKPQTERTEIPITSSGSCLLQPCVSFTFCQIQTRRIQGK